MVVVEEPAAKGQLKLLSPLLSSQVIELLIVDRMGPLHPAIEPWGSGDVCPMDVLRMDEKGEKAVITYPLDCMTCFNCELECDPNAIYVSPERAKDIVLPW